MPEPEFASGAQPGSRLGGSAVTDPGLEHGGVASALGDEFVVAPEFDDAPVVDLGERWRADGR